MEEEKLIQLYEKILHVSINETGALKGPVFVIKQKEDFATSNGVRGIITRNIFSLLQLSKDHSHFTPNIYRYGSFFSEEKLIKGFEERNLKQINSFVIDIDTHIHSLQSILLACLDYSVGSPTFIVKSPRGYQIHFVLTEPLYISNSKNFQILKIAKRISRNIKRSLECIDADPCCNDFGFFRLPSKKNVIWTNLEQTYSIKQLINWSSSFDEGEPLYHPKVDAKNPFYQEWIEALLKMRNVKGKKSKIGRNNALFTLALVCYQGGLSITVAQDYLEELNNRFAPSLRFPELMTVLQSAYSGKYHGASYEYLVSLLKLYAPNERIPTFSTNWYKFKKPRENRIRSHFYEWEQDLNQFIESQHFTHSPFVWKTQKELCEILNIPQSSLNALIKNSNTILKVTKGKGRAAITGWTTRKVFLGFLRRTLLQKKKKYQIYLFTVLKRVKFFNNPCYFDTLYTLKYENNRMKFYDSA